MGAPWRTHKSAHGWVFASRVKKRKDKKRIGKS